MPVRFGIGVQVVDSSGGVGGDSLCSGQRGGRGEGRESTAREVGCLRVGRGAGVLG